MIRSIVRAAAVVLLVSRGAPAQTWITQTRTLAFGSVVLGVSTSVSAASSDARSGTWSITIGSGKNNCRVDLTLSASSSNTLLSTTSSRTIGITYTQAVLVNADLTTKTIAVGATVTNIKIVYPATVYIGGTIMETTARAGPYTGSLTLTGANPQAC